jgi:hypothetical protein
LFIQSLAERGGIENGVGETNRFKVAERSLSQLLANTLMTKGWLNIYSPNVAIAAILRFKGDGI